MVDERLLRIYLNDHLAGAVGGIELAKRACSSNAGTPWGGRLADLVRDLEADRTELASLMERLGYRSQTYKQTAVWFLEKIGRLKLNGRLAGYSELSRVIELEALKLGVTGKLSLWTTLKRLADQGANLPIELEQLIERAEAQLEALEQMRLEAVDLLR